MTIFVLIALMLAIAFSINKMLKKRKGNKGRSQPRTAQRYDFIGVEFQCQSHFTGGGRQAAGLSDREHASLAKDIAKPVSYTHLDVYKRQTVPLPTS